MSNDPFTFDFHALDDPDEHQRWSTWRQVQPLCRGPKPRPSWVVTDQGAIDSQLGVLKTGKEADVFLLQRATPGTDGVVMAAKRYRDADHRSFRRASAYTEGRRTRRTRDTRALAKKSAYGKQVAAGQWAFAEWDSLTRLWNWGLPVPYPVQIDGAEILMELIVDDTGNPAPRLASLSHGSSDLPLAFEQVREFIIRLAGHGVVHGDLSAYNMLISDRITVIDLPQTIDLVANPQGTDFLLRDCVNVCEWFTKKGLACDADELFGEALASAW